MLKLVICDDLEKARYILREFIKKIDIKEVEIVGEAENGFELIELCKKVQPDVILLDIDMPGMGGIEAAREIKKIFPKTLYIFISAYPAHAIETFEVYPVDFILKPYSIERLERALASLF